MAMPAAAAKPQTFKTWRRKLGDEFAMELTIRMGLEVTNEYGELDMAPIYAACLDDFHRRMLDHSPTVRPKEWSDSKWFALSAFPDKTSWTNFFLRFRNTGQSLTKTCSPLVGIPEDKAAFGKTLWTKVLARVSGVNLFINAFTPVQPHQI